MSRPCGGAGLEYMLTRGQHSGRTQDLECVRADHAVGHGVPLRQVQVLQQ